MAATHITATQLLTKRGDILRRCSRDKEHFIVELHGVPIVAIIPVEEHQRRQPSKRRRPVSPARKSDTSSSRYKTVYEALERARGAITDPALHDASSTIDDAVYGDET